MQSDPRGPTEMRVLLIIGGVIVFGSPIYYILAWGLGVKDTTIAVFVLLAIAAFVIVRRYSNRHHIRQPSNKSFRSTSSTRDWPQKYRKHRRQQYKATLNNREKSRTSRTRRAANMTAHFLNSTALRLITRSEMDKRLDNRLHHQTRWSDEIYP